MARVNGAAEVDVAIAYLRQGGGIRWDRAHLDEFALEAAAARVRRVMAQVDAAVWAAARGGALGYGTGLHCRRCPALAFCPAQTALLLAALGRPLAPGEIAKLSDEDAGRAYVQLKVMEEQVANGLAGARARAERAGLPLPDGDRLVPVETQRRALNLDKALPVLREAFGAQADEQVERSLSAEAVTRLARQLAPGKGQKKAADALWAKLDAAGAVRRSSFVQLRVKKGAEA